MQQHLRVGRAGSRVHLSHETLGAPRDMFQPVLPGGLQPEAMPVQLLRGRVQHPVEFEYGDRVPQLDAASQNSEPLRNGGLGFLGRGGEITGPGPALHPLRRRVELKQHVCLGFIDRRRHGL